MQSHSITTRTRKRGTAECQDAFFSDLALKTAPSAKNTSEKKKGTSMDSPALEILHYKDDEQSSALLLQLNKLREENILTDIIMCADNTEISCHRNVLVSSSPYFRAMFCNNFIETQQTKVVIKGIGPIILTSIVDYVYTGLISINLDNVLHLMQAASMLQYGRLFEACSCFLQAQLRPDNCLSMIRLSDMMDCDSLREKAKKMAIKSFTDVSLSEDLYELSLQELMEYLDDDRLCAEEEQVFETLVAWIHHDPISRHGTISNLFKKVRLRHLHPTYLFQFIANDPLIQSSTLCNEIIESVRRLMFSVGTRSIRDLMVDFKTLWAAPHRCSYNDTLVVMGGRRNNEQTSREALIFDEKNQKWQRLTKLPVRLHKASYVALHSILYVLGGLTTNTNCSQVSRTVYTLSLKTNQWRTAEPMLEPRFAHQSVSYLHFIFILGGLGSDRQLTTSMERYNSMFNQWEAVSPIPEAVLHPAVAATNQRIYMFGGQDATYNPVRLIQVYHIGRNMWSKMENRTVKNVSAPAVVVDEKIYIIGGYTRRVIAYDTEANTFIKCANLKERRMHHAAACLNNKLYVTGGRYISGHNLIEDLDTLECFHPKTDTWTHKGTLPYKLFDHGSLTLTCIVQNWKKS
ncbi:kelch-like protein 38 [Girardinichthys multiradiatus]|uniref:kelch-like protein 38 n=1 Tax=Girardinichthys multiradiatus TaxID=208333 RepID=UPI001FAD3240|nr:kelch-like protein 38 [Girardinichthys multiradiatus]XP_047216370.1 kelch-like protein 38 [Girardinichthys multiradiatus]